MPTTQTPIRPLKLPTMTFIVSDHNTIPVAIDAATKLLDHEPDLSYRDFMEPVLDAFSSFVDLDFGADLTDPRAHPHSDTITHLLEWAETHFGEDYIGGFALPEVDEQLDFRSGPILFRDARWQWLKPFLETYRPHEVLIIDLLGKPHGLPGELYKPFAGSHVIVGNPTVDNVVAAIVGACS